MYQSNEDIAPISVIHLMKRIVTGGGSPTLAECKDATDVIRSNAVVREFVSNLMLSRQRISASLTEIAKEIS